MAKECSVFDVYCTQFGATPNVYKVLVLLEELSLQHRIIPIDIRRGEQFNPEFLKISPNNKVPVLIDHAPVDGGQPLFEGRIADGLNCEKIPRLILGLLNSSLLN